MLRRGLAYAAGVAVGVAPLLAYQWWAFGDPLHLAYRDAVSVGGVSGHDEIGANSAGFFGVSAPDLGTATELLFGRIGLLTLSPVLALGAAGTVLLYRRGLRAEALAIGGVALAYLAYDSGYHDPFGGFSPGPRFLVPILPFLAVPLALAFRRLPLTTLALGVVSMLAMSAVTVTGPLLAHDGRWHERLADGWFGGRSWVTVVPFLVCAVAAVWLGVRATPRLEGAGGERWTALAALAGWALVATVGWRTLGVPDAGLTGSPLPVLALAAGVTLVVVAFALRARRLPAEPRAGLVELRLGVLELARERLHHLPGDRPVALDERAEVPGGHAEAAEIAVGGDRRRAVAACDQRDLAEVVAGAELARARRRGRSRSPCLPR